jgi:hypothetical protein
VADRLRAGGRVFCFHLAAVRRKGQRQTRQPGFLLMESSSHDSTRSKAPARSPTGAAQRKSVRARWTPLGAFAFRTVALTMLASAFWCAALYGVAIQLPAEGAERL